MDKILSVIELQNNHYFIYVSNEKMKYKIIDECQICYDFVKKNKPIKIIEQIKLKDEFSVDSTVKLYMHMYGYNFVRGGSYIEDNLSKEQEMIIEKELYYIENMNDIEYSLQSIQRYNKHYTSIEEIDENILKVRENYEKYEFEKSRYDRIIPIPYKNIIKKIIPEDIDFLYDICIIIQKNTNTGILDPFSFIDNRVNYIQKYKYINQGIKYLYFLYIHTDFFISVSRDIEEYLIYLKHPEFLFDEFIYHTTKNKKSYFKLEQFCLLIKTLFYITLNRIEEYEFDLSTYEYNIEWITPRILYVLDKKKHEFGLNNNILEVD